MVQCIVNNCNGAVHHYTSKDIFLMLISFNFFQIFVCLVLILLQHFLNNIPTQQRFMFPYKYLYVPMIYLYVPMKYLYVPMKYLYVPMKYLYIPMIYLYVPVQNLHISIQNLYVFILYTIFIMIPETPLAHLNVQFISTIQLLRDSINDLYQQKCHFKWIFDVSTKCAGLQMPNMGNWEHAVRTRAQVHGQLRTNSENEPYIRTNRWEPFVKKTR
jgi:hypothetical protein